MPIKDTVNRNRAASSRGQLAFPPAGGKHGMLFSFKPYEYAETHQVLSNPGQGDVVLPIPLTGLKESTGISLSDYDLGLTGALTADATAIGVSLSNSSDIIGDAGTMASNAYQNLAGQAKNGSTVASAASAVGSAALRSAGSSLAPQLVAGFDVGKGQTMNNFTTLTFNNVNLRSHSFSWIFYPESSEDSDIISQIRMKFQQAAHPSYVAGGKGTIGRVLLNYPMLVFPYVLIDGADKYFYQFKPCLIENVTFTYLNDNGVALMKGGKPASVAMSLSLKETAIWTGEDYGVESGARGTFGDVGQSPAFSGLNNIASDLLGGG